MDQRSDLGADAAAAMINDDSFQRTYRCSPSPIQTGNRIVMPPSALQSLIDEGVECPWLFELCNPLTGKTSHCGVLEFTSEEGSVLLPAMMMESMKLDEGNIVTMKSTHLDKGTFLKLQPHTTRFMQLSNPKSVLEIALRDFCCLTTGDTIMVKHDNFKFYVNVVEAKPSSAIDILNIDCEVDFALPLDYEPPKKKQKKAVEVAQKQPTMEEEPVKFKAFSGLARRLDGRPVTVRVAVVDDDSRVMSTVERKPCESRKVVFGSNINPSQNESTGEESLIRTGQKKETDTKKQVEKFQPFTGRSYRLQ